MKVWDAFVKDYSHILVDRPLRFILEAFWYFVIDGSYTCDKFLREEGKKEYEKTMR